MGICARTGNLLLSYGFGMSLSSNFVIYELMSVVIWMMKIRRLDPHSTPQERPKLARSHLVVVPLSDCYENYLPLDPLQGC